MIKYTIDDKTLVIPSGLGFGGQSSGGGVTPEEAAEIASAVTEAAIDEYDADLQVDLEDIRDAVSGNTDAIEELSASTSDAISSLSGATSGMSADIAALSGQTSANTENIASLSAATGAISESLGNYATTADTNELATAISGVSDSLSNYATTAVTNEISTAVSGITDSLGNYATTATTDALSAVTSALTENLEAFSGSVKEDIYVSLGELTAMTTEQKTAYWEQLEQKYLNGHRILLKGKTNSDTDGYLPLVKYQPYTEGNIYTGYFGFSTIDGGGNGYYDVNFWHRGALMGNSGSQVQKKTMYTLPTAGSAKGGVKVGSGLTMNGEVMSVNIGEGLAFSGNTLVVSGGTGGGKETIIINNLDSTGLAALANRLFGYYDSEDGTIDFPVDELELYWWLPDPNYVGGYDDNGYKDYVKVMPVNVEEADGDTGMWLSGPFSLGGFESGNFLRDFRVFITQQGGLLGAGVDAVPIPEIPTIPQPGYTRFGNEERGYLYYDADNDRFQYDSGYIATGDTTTVYPDVIDTRFTDALIDGGLIDGYIYADNLNKLYVIESGVTKEYCHPTLSRRAISETVDGVYFSYEITYDYGDWKFTAYYGGLPEGAEERSNNAANLRMTTPYIV